MYLAGLHKLIFGLASQSCMKNVPAKSSAKIYLILEIVYQANHEIDVSCTNFGVLNTNVSIYSFITYIVNGSESGLFTNETTDLYTA